MSRSAMLMLRKPVQVGAARLTAYPEGSEPQASTLYPYDGASKVQGALWGKGSGLRHASSTSRDQDGGEATYCMSTIILMPGSCSREEVVPGSLELGDRQIRSVDQGRAAIASGDFLAPGSSRCTPTPLEAFYANARSSVAKCAGRGAGARWPDGGGRRDHSLRCHL